MGKNVFGQDLMTCSSDPLTGYFRDGCCNTDETDQGTHTVCAQMTDEFLAFTKARGNDLSTPRPEWNFPGLKAGDFWCLCVLRWKEALEQGAAPKIKLEATHERSLDHVSMDELIQHSLRSSNDPA